MSQMLHIFRKDSRRFWPEILLSLAVNLSCVLFYWRHVEMLLVYLLPLCWWLLIGRVVQAESLVGENQAWLTRPYEWPKLLAAKSLFLAAYLYLPLAVMQSLVLWMAGLPPAAHALGLAYDWLLLAAAIVLPLFAIAAVTRNFVRMTLTLLGIFVAMAALNLLAANWRPRYPQFGNIPSIGYSAAGMMPGLAFSLCFFAAVLLLHMPRAACGLRGR